MREALLDSSEINSGVPPVVPMNMYTVDMSKIVENHCEVV